MTEFQQQFIVAESKNYLGCKRPLRPAKRIVKTDAEQWLWGNRRMACVWLCQLCMAAWPHQCLKLRWNCAVTRVCCKYWGVAQLNSCLRGKKYWSKGKVKQQIIDYICQIRRIILIYYAHFFIIHNLGEVIKNIIQHSQASAVCSASLHGIFFRKAGLKMDNLRYNSIPLAA